MKYLHYCLDMQNIANVSYRKIWFADVLVHKAVIYLFLVELNH